jgi:formylglycine-generating enzyme required for sulfatase activity
MHHLKKHLLLLFLLAGIFTLQAQPEDLTIEKAKQLKTNVVKLEVQYEDGGTGYGFGFVTNEQDGRLFLVTAAHVTHGGSFDREPQRISLSFSNTLERKIASELTWFEADDLALLYAEIPLGYQWDKEFLGFKAETFTKVRFYGDNFLIMDGGELIDVTDNRRLRFNSNAVFPGISGAPLVSKNGIIGMITDDSRENASALSIQRIRDKLQLPAGGSPYFHESEPPITEDEEPGTVQDGFVKITGGSFEMGDQFNEGDSDEKPVHTVRVSDFMMSPTEVTNEEVAAFLSAEGNQTTYRTRWYNYGQIRKTDGAFKSKPGHEQHPVTDLNWYGAVHFCNWKSEQAGLTKVYKISGTGVTPDWLADGYRLPTEAEWEYAAREGGRKVRFGNGENVARNLEMNICCKEENSQGKIIAVNTLKKNSLGLYHMSGNVAEWCWDAYSEGYYRNRDSVSNPRGPSAGDIDKRVLRGGSWNAPSKDSRTAARNWCPPVITMYDIGYIGLRLVRNAP